MGDWLQIIMGGNMIITVKFHSTNISGSARPLHEYHAIGSKDQIIEAARVLTTQRLELRGRELLVIFSDNNNRTLFERGMIDGAVL